MHMRMPMPMRVRIHIHTSRHTHTHIQEGAAASHLPLGATSATDVALSQDLALQTFDDALRDAMDMSAAKSSRELRSVPNSTKTGHVGPQFGRFGPRPAKVRPNVVDLGQQLANFGQC